MLRKTIIGEKYFVKLIIRKDHNEIEWLFLKNLVGEER